MASRNLIRHFCFGANGLPRRMIQRGVNSMPTNKSDTISGIADLKSIYKAPFNIRFQSVASDELFFESPHLSSKEKAGVEAKMKEETDDQKLIKEHSSLFVNNFRRSDLVSIYQGNNLNERLDNDVERSLAVYLYEIIIKNEFLSSQTPSPTNYEGLPDVNESMHSCSTNFVIYLLSKLGLNEYPFCMLLNQDYSFKSDSFQSVNAKPTITVVKHFQNIRLINESFFLHNLKTDGELSECQVAVGLVAAACTNYHRPFGLARRRDQLIYAFRVAGAQFTFYKAFIPVSYIRAIDPASSLPPEEELVIYKYPPANEDSPTHYGLDYVEEKERPTIIKMLLKLKSLLAETD